MNTIDQVIQRMDEIVYECRTTKSRVGYFAILYRQVTHRIKQGIESSEFDDNMRMERLDILFAQRFFDAYEAYNNALGTTKSWLCAFENAKTSGHLVLQHLLLGINTHVNLDLGIATVETMDGAEMSGIKDDFDKINRVLAELVDGVKADLSKVSPIFGFLIRFAHGEDEMLLDFSITLARDGAWKFANAYRLAADKNECLEIRDTAIANLGYKLANPGLFLNILVKVIGWGEWKSIPRVMDQLDVIAEKSLPKSLI